MKLLKIIKDKKLPLNQSGLRIREASRAVLFDKNGLIPLLFVAKYNYHKLPGGIAKHEDRIRALVREIIEEVGSKIEVSSNLGKIIEYHSKFNLKQTSYCYLGKIISKGKPNFTKKEANHGFKLIWLPLNRQLIN